MRRHSVTQLHGLWLALTLLCTPLTVMAENDFRAPARVAVVYFSDLLVKAPQALSANNSLKERFQATENALDMEKKAIADLEAEFNAMLADKVLSEEEKQDKQRELRDRTRKYKRALEDLKEEIRLTREENILDLQKEIYQAIGAVREREGIDLVLSENDYIVASKRLDITPLVMEYLRQTASNKASAVGADNDNSSKQE